MQLVQQGNRLSDLFKWTAAGIAPERIQADQHGIEAIQAAEQQQPLTGQKLVDQLVRRVKESLDQEAREILKDFTGVFSEQATAELDALLADSQGNKRQRLTIARAVADLERFIIGVCQRLAQDAEKIHEHFGFNLRDDRPTGIKLDCGDRHRDGESTSIIQFRSGRKLAYKPRDMSLECALQDILDPGTVPATLNCGNYGYQDIVETSEPSLETGKNLGRLIASLDVLGAVDLHQGNIIIGRDQAWLIDGETVLHRKFQSLRGNLSGHPPLGDSVLSLGVIAPPTSLPMRGSRLWVSRHGLSRLLIQKSPEEQIDQQESKLVNLTNHEEALLTAYLGHLRHRHGAGGFKTHHLKNLKGLRRRIVMRNTRLYSAVLKALDHQPSRYKAENILDRLWDLYRTKPGHPVLLDLANAEALELCRGHIPLFSTRIGEKDLDHVDGISIKAGYHKNIVKDTIRRQRLRGTATDQAWQYTLLRSALYLFRTPTLSRGRVGESSADKAIQLIREHLQETTLYWRGHRLWLTIDSKDGDPNPIYSVPNNLYGGARGIELTLHWLSIHHHKNFRTNSGHKQRRYTRRSHHFFRLESFSKEELSALNSELLAWALEPGQQTGKRTLPSIMRRDLKRIKHHFRQARSNSAYSGSLGATSCDVISGIAGLIGAIHAIRRRTQASEQDRLRAIQMELAQSLLTLQNSEGCWPDPNPVLSGITGFSHGTAGIAAALGTVHDEAPEAIKQKIRSSIEHAIKHELKWTNAEGDWQDLRSQRLDSGSTRGIGQSWCHGAPGALLAAVILHSHGLDQKIRNYRRWLELARESTLRAQPRNDSLCCGTSGLIIILEVAGKLLNDPELNKEAIDLRQKLAQKVCNKETILGEYFPLQLHQPGLFNGYSGVALALKGINEIHALQTLISYGML